MPKGPEIRAIQPQIPIRKEIEEEIDNNQEIRPTIDETEEDLQMVQTIRDLISLRKKLRDISEKTDVSNVTRWDIVGTTLAFILEPTLRREEQVLAALEVHLRRQVMQHSRRDRKTVRWTIPLD